MERMSTGSDTEFTEWLRGRADEHLRALVAARPELITPVPAHVEGLAARASTPSALGRALDRLDRFTLAVVETLTLQPGPVACGPLKALLARSLAGTAKPEELDSAFLDALDRLRTRGLIYGPDHALLPAPGVREALDPPAGLGPPAVDVFRHHAPELLETLLADNIPGDVVSADHPAVGGTPKDRLTPPSGETAPASGVGGGSSKNRRTAPIRDTASARGVGGGAPRERLAALLGDRATVERLVGEVSPPARAALDELAWGPPSGRLANARREVRTATAQSPIEQLLARGLLGATGEETVVMPREVALFLRGGRIHRDLSPRPPELDGARRDPVLADRTAAGQAFTFVRTVEELCELWSVDPPGVLRTGGLAVRDLKRTAQLLDLPEYAAAFVVEVAHAAGLIASGGSVDGEWLPTASYDGWRIKATEDRWVLLASAWSSMNRAPGFVGERDDRDRARGALHPDLRRSAAAEVRARTLAVLASASPGVAPSGESVLARLAWEQPRRRGADRDRLAEFTLREAELLGVTGLGVLSGHGRALPSSTHTAAELLAPLLPQPVAHVLLQADLTAVAPGPVTSELGRWLTLAADVESKGGATVYRFGERSIRRALDAGQSADDLVMMLERCSATPVPQPLRYLVADVARRHGSIRVGTASAYVRCDDPSVLEEVLADRRAAPLRLRRLAPTVLASKTSRATLVDSLRAMGYAPVAESLDGDVLVSRADARRAEGPPVSRVAGSGGPEPEVVVAAVRAMRAGDEAHQARRGPADAPDGQVPRSPATATILALQEAIRQGSRVWIGYLDSQGHATSRILEPARMEGGYLTAYDETRAAIHRFAVHRITGIADVN